MNKPALANKWYVYYAYSPEDDWLEDDDEEDKEELSWDEMTLCIDIKNNELNEGDKVLVVSPSGYGWKKIAWQEDWKEWKEPLPLSAYRKFISAVFLEL